MVNGAVGDAALRSYDRVAIGAAWVGAGLLAAALVLIARPGTTRLVLWPVAVALAWVAAPVVTAASYLEVYVRPGAGLPAGLGEASAATWDVFVAAASSPVHRPGGLWPWVVAVLAAAVLAFAPHVVRRGRGMPGAVTPTGSHRPDR